MCRLWSNGNSTAPMVLWRILRCVQQEHSGINDQCLLHAGRCEDQTLLSCVRPASDSKNLPSCLFWDWASLHRTGYPGTCYVTPVGLEFTAIPLPLCSDHRPELPSPSKSWHLYGPSRPLQTVAFSPSTSFCLDCSTPCALEQRPQSAPGYRSDTVSASLINQSINQLKPNCTQIMSLDFFHSEP